MSTNTDDSKWYGYTSSTQTMRTWAKRLNSIDEIPPTFREAFPVSKTPDPYLLFIPEDKYTLFLQRTPQILAMYDDHFVLLQIERGQIKTYSSPFSEVLYLERGKILLYSWLTIKTISDSVSMKFNTTNESLFEPVIEKIRRGTNGLNQAEDTDRNSQQADSVFDPLGTVNYKYMNYGRQSVRAGDTVVEMILQPARVVQEFNLFGKSLFKRYATEHLSILTERELILIKENKHIKTAKEALYGGVFTTIPQHRINEITFTPDEKDSICSMQIVLPENVCFTSEFSLDNPQLEKFQQAVKK